MSLKLNNWNPKHPTSASLPHTATCLQHVSPPLQHASVLLQHAAIPLQHATVPLQRAAPPLQQLLTRSSNDNDRFSLYQQKPGNNTIKAVDGYNSHSQELQQESKPLRSTAVAENQGRPSLTPSSAAKGQEHFSLIFSTTKEPQHAQLWLSSAAKEKKLKFNLAPKERAHTMLRSKSVPKERAHAMLKSNSVPKERAHTMLRANSVPKERAHAMLKSNSVPKERAHTMLRSKSAAKRLEDSPFTATLSAREQDDAPFISPATAVQEYLMTCEDQPGEPDACVPLIAGQKESSV
ncbi:hypothetical protein OTU49_006080 [Cherax quadricarinatus]|uniref:Uncharacterized protein n=4 Tax=Cherax quadricarinatus TaxID=27406 RepID=A0AAW0X4Z9_CHEQU